MYLLFTFIKKKEKNGKKGRHEKIEEEKEVVNKVFEMVIDSIELYQLLP